MLLQIDEYVVDITMCILLAQSPLKTLTFCTKISIEPMVSNFTQRPTPFPPAREWVKDPAFVSILGVWHDLGHYLHTQPRRGGENRQLRSGSLPVG